MSTDNLGRHFNHLTLDNAIKMLTLKGSNHKVLFQNSEGSINLGFMFDNPSVQMTDIYWIHIIGSIIEHSLHQNDGLITVDSRHKTKSCYVELHRNIIHNYINNIYDKTSLLSMCHIVCGNKVNIAKSSRWLGRSKSYCSANSVQIVSS